MDKKSNSFPFTAIPNYLVEEISIEDFLIALKTTLQNNENLNYVQIIQSKINQSVKIKEQQFNFFKNESIHTDSPLQI